MYWVAVVRRRSVTQAYINKTSFARDHNIQGEKTPHSG